MDARGARGARDAVVATDPAPADADCDNGTPSMVPGRALPRRVGKLLFRSLGHDPSGIRRRFVRMFWRQECTHTDQIRKDVVPSAQGCEECLRTGDGWVHLRECLICGHIGCCDESENKHATKHFRHTGHPIIRSFEPGEDWRYCYVDDVVL